MSTITDSRPDVGINLQPFRHRVIDDWTDPELVRAAEAEWPDHRWPFWHRYENGKLASKDPLRYPPACAELVRRMLCLPVPGDVDPAGAPDFVMVQHMVQKPLQRQNAARAPG